jgi:hypothetical protein
MPDVLNGFFAEAWTSTKPLATVPLPMPTMQVELCINGQIKQALIRLSPRKACGPDGIPAWLLKDHAPVITHIVNTSYRQGTVPASWKTANVCPIPKVSNPRTTTDWRPISITSCLGKIQESFIMKKTNADSSV